MSMTLFDQLLTGEKPPQSMLDFVEIRMNKLQFPLGKKFRMKIRHSDDHVEEKTFELPHVGKAMTLKLNMVASMLYHEFLDDPTNPETDPRFTQVQNLILYWYGMCWLPPILDYHERIETEGSAIKMYTDEFTSGDPFPVFDTEKGAQGLRPNKGRLSGTNSYLYSTFGHLPSPGGNTPGIMKIVHGVGPITGAETPVILAIKCIQAAGAKLAKSEFYIESLSTDEEVEKAYAMANDLIIYWTLKHWIHLPLPNKKNTPST